MTFSISSRQVMIALNLVIAFLLIAHLAGQFSGHVLDNPSLKGTVPRFNMNGEGSVPTFVAALLLAVCSAFFALIAIDARRNGDRRWRGWATLAVVFAYVTLDEAVAIHEQTIAPLRDLFGVSEGWLHFAWVLPAAVLVAIGALALFPFLRDLHKPTRNGMAAAAALYVAGALGVEMVGGWYLSTRGDDYLYEVIGAVEEVLELEGTTLLLATLVAHVGRAAGGIRFCFAAR